jgi:voltage-gated potassium channel
MTTATTALRPGAPRSPEDAAALARFDARMALPLVLAAVLPLFLIPDGGDDWFDVAVNIVAWVVFVVDLVVHERRLVHYLRSWLGRFDLAVVVLTAPWFLFFPTESRFVMLVRLARVARVVMATRGAHRLFERLGRVALVAIVVVFLGAAVAYRAEHPTNPEFATYGDALWWGTVTLTTVGYGDIVPETTTGRIAGVLIMVTGISVLGLLAGSLASFFRLEGGGPGAAPAAGDDRGAGGADGDGLHRDVVALREQVAELTRAIAIMSDSRDPPDHGRPDHGR